MSKYNIHEVNAKEAQYHACINEKTKDLLHDKIVKILIDDGNFVDPDFTANKLAKALDIAPQIVSVVFATRFHKSFSLYVNDCRIEYATALLADKKNKHLNLAWIGEMCGFGTMQSFYANFYRRMGCTPNEYKKRCFSTK